MSDLIEKVLKQHWGAISYCGEKPNVCFMSDKTNKNLYGFIESFSVITKHKGSRTILGCKIITADLPENKVVFARDGEDE